MTAAFVYGVLIGLLATLPLLPLVLASRARWKQVADGWEKNRDWWRDRVEGYKADLAVAEGQIADLKGQVSRKDKEIEGLKDEVREADEGLKVQSDEIERCHAELTAIEAELAAQKNCNERQRETISDQAERIAKTLADLHLARKDIGIINGCVGRAAELSAEVYRAATSLYGYLNTGNA